MELTELTKRLENRTKISNAELRNLIGNCHCKGCKDPECQGVYQELNKMMLEIGFTKVSSMRDKRGLGSRGYRRR